LRISVMNPLITLGSPFLFLMTALNIMVIAGTL
jgi:hypothetical protein